jgi:hypothetical protein
VRLVGEKEEDDGMAAWKQKKQACSTKAGLAPPTGGSGLRGDGVPTDDLQLLLPLFSSPPSLLLRRRCGRGGFSPKAARVGRTQGLWRGYL